MPVSCPSRFPSPGNYLSTPPLGSASAGLSHSPDHASGLPSSLRLSSGLLRVAAWLRALFLFPARVHMLHAHSAVTHSSPWDPSPLAPLDPPLTPQRLAGSLQPWGPLGQQPGSSWAHSLRPGSAKQFLGRTLPWASLTPAHTRMHTRVHTHLSVALRPHNMCQALCSLSRVHRAPPIPCCTCNQCTAAVGRGPRSL